MKTSPYFIDDAPLQILLFDEEAGSGRNFFNSGLGTIWFDYDLHRIDNLAEARIFLEPVIQKQRKLDLLFIANSIWTNGGENFVELIRTHAHLAELPVYCVASCAHKKIVGDTTCMNWNWRQQNNCDHHSRIAAVPYAPYLANDHPAYLNGVLCGNNISDQLTNIVNNMSAYWFQCDNV